MPNLLQVGPQVATDLQAVNQRGDNYGNTTIQEAGAYYQEAVRRGYGFIYSQAATGVALAVPASGASTNFMIWNPTRSGKWFVPCKITLGIVSTTAVLGNLALYYVPDAGDGIGTAARIASFTAATPVNALVGQGAPVSAMNFAPAVENITGGATFLKTLGWTILANDLTGKNMQTFETDLQGSLIFKPGTAMVVACSTAIASVCVISCFGLEIPAPAGA